MLETTIFPGQVMAGRILSSTERLNVQVAIRPAPSVTLRVTGVVPVDTMAPASGVCVIAPNGSEQLSVAVASVV